MLNTERPIGKVKRGLEIGIVIEVAVPNELVLAIEGPDPLCEGWIDAIKILAAEDRDATGLCGGAWSLAPGWGKVFPQAKRQNDSRNA